MTGNSSRVLPRYEQPRERLLRQGSKALADYELLAILLRTGSNKQSVVDLSLSVLQCFGDLAHLRQASLRELQSIQGVGPVKALEIKAALELGERLACSHPIRGQAIRCVEDAGQVFAHRIGHCHQEKLYALFLSTKNEILKEKVIFAGGLNSSVAHPREIFREAVKESAARVMVAHNHPSGHTTPSQADLAFTKRLKECGELIGIELLDHFIVADQDYVSLKELRLM
ncbi:JAB domain-containing protein [Atopobacter sp. AH10]|uniref:RadC family protein n=1 Tax=Atopobacter sp. AH10 TaxID=2315861 RepID=UPI000EF2062C|nr:DNA repair protein RadC [Atopobacter sp. AH10]RLK62969.1 JAB domain-containing protein [Atopobacter sp. AH10]